MTGVLRTTGTVVDDGLVLMPSDAAYRELRDRAIERNNDNFGTMAAYDNIIALAGDAGFFGLWAGVADDIGSTSRLICAALIGTSLILYVSWHIGQMSFRQYWNFRQASSFDLASENPQAFLIEYKRISGLETIAFAKLLKIWPFVFIPTVVTGLAGAGVLVLSSTFALF